MSEFDRVAGGGLIPGSLVLIGGEPGIGKSTLVLQLALGMEGRRILYVSGERVSNSSSYGPEGLEEITRVFTS